MCRCCWDPGVIRRIEDRRGKEEDGKMGWKQMREGTEDNDEMTDDDKGAVRSRTASMATIGCLVSCSKIRPTVQTHAAHSYSSSYAPRDGDQSRIFSRHA